VAQRLLLTLAFVIVLPHRVAQRGVRVAAVVGWRDHGVFGSRRPPPPARRFFRLSTNNPGFPFGRNVPRFLTDRIKED